ncbi:hypothetical protein PO118_01695, partial [Bacteroides thetaiotaomicron]|nr:hypothetical protein [Bacteroides thetaiotaomicron]
MRNKKEVIQQLSVREFTKLEKLYLLPFDSVMNIYDLSNDSIVDFPDLSSYTMLNSTCKCNRILINNLFKFFVWREVS